jgi:hypothetical protein
MNSLTVAASTAVVCLALVASPALALDPIDLGSGNTLTVSSDAAAKTTTVTLASEGAVVESVTLGNAGVKPEDVKSYKLCAGCSAAYFVPLHDLTSTYGATTGVVVWEGGWWNLTVLPLSVAGVAGPDKRGVYWLTDTGELGGKVRVDRYWFVDGFLKPR